LPIADHRPTLNHVGGWSSIMRDDDPNAPVAPPTSAGTGAILCGWAIWIVIILALTAWTGAQLLSRQGAPPVGLAATVSPAGPPPSVDQIEPHETDGSR
jgi:hypothetical protein